MTLARGFPVVLYTSFDAVEWNGERRDEMTGLCLLFLSEGAFMGSF